MTFSQQLPYKFIIIPLQNLHTLLNLYMLLSKLPYQLHSRILTQQSHSLPIYISIRICSISYILLCIFEDLLHTLCPFGQYS